MSTAKPDRDVLSRIAEPLQRITLEIDNLMDAALPVPDDGSERLVEAIRYAALKGGKRLRPLLVTASAELFDVPPPFALRAALAVECVHVHSLVHDDLPCMDDDDLRRGRPTVHVAFDEATAVLAGDSLLAMAFQILCAPATHPDAEVRAELTVELARAAGAYGMAAGQCMDLLPPGQIADIEAITRLQRLKTGALISWSVEAGAILGAASAEARISLRGYAQSVGLAFQIVDDLLDHGGNEATVGKRLRKDEAQGKQSFVTMLGERKARRQAELLVEQAIDHLRAFGPRADLLAAVAEFTISRDR